MKAVGIHQIYYKPSQVKGLDPEAIPYDNSTYCKVIPTLENEREYRVFKDNYDAKTHLDYDYTGFVSWKFNNKTKGKTIGDLKQVILNDDGQYDVYFTSCGPVVSNVWRQGESRSKHIIDITQHVFNEIGYSINLSTFINRHDQCSFCNFWAGNHTFWQKYMSFTKPVYNYLTSSENNFTQEMYDRYISKADAGIEANYFPFIMERMFTTLLVNDSTIKSKKI